MNIQRLIANYVPTNQQDSAIIAYLQSLQIATETCFEIYASFVRHGNLLLAPDITLLEDTILSLSLSSLPLGCQRAIGGTVEIINEELLWIAETDMDWSRTYLLEKLTSISRQIYDVTQVLENAYQSRHAQQKIKTLSEFPRLKISLPLTHQTGS